MFEKSFIDENMMGPNALRIIDELTEDLDLEIGMKVLDLGCGRGLTSFYLAKKYDIFVYAADLWIDPSDNYERAKELGLDDSVIPIRVDATEMPFASNYFDVIISIDAFQYFGKEAEFLDQHVSRLLKPGGKLLVAVPGIKDIYEGNIPKVMRDFGVVEEYFHSGQWWKKLWEASKLVKNIETYDMACFDEAWKDWLATDNKHAIEDREMIAADGGKVMNLVALRAEKR